MVIAGACLFSPGCIISSTVHCLYDAVCIEPPVPDRMGKLTRKHNFLLLHPTFCLQVTKLNARYRLIRCGLALLLLCHVRSCIMEVLE